MGINVYSPTAKKASLNYDGTSDITVDLGDIANSSDVYTQTQADALLNTKAPIVSPTFTGTQTLPKAIVAYDDADRVFTIGTSIADAVYEFVSPDGTIVGKNNNGSYTKFVDGTMICTAYGAATSLPSIPVGGGYQGSTFNIIGMPASFSTSVGLNFAISPIYTGGTSRTWGTYQTYTTGQVSVMLHSFNDASTSAAEIKVIAVGRWKD